MAKRETEFIDNDLFIEPCWDELDPKEDPMSTMKITKEKENNHWDKSYRWNCSSSL
jgi:hypothetical protein